MTETGSVSPVMTVERQEFRKVKTTSTVSSAPMMIVVFTSSTESRIQTELSRTIDSSTPSGSRSRQLLDRGLDLLGDLAPCSRRSPCGGRCRSPARR